MEDIWAQRKQWAGEVKAMRNTIDKAREKGLELAKAERKGKASVAELRKMQEQLRIEEERRRAEAAAKASSATAYSASPSTPTASADAAEATASYGEATVEAWEPPIADEGSVDAGVGVVATTPKRIATAPVSYTHLTLPTTPYV